MKNYYAILEVPVGCSLEEIRQAYHRLVQEHLDDEAVFADLKEAYEVLTTPSRRDSYDRAAWGETFDSLSQINAPAAFGLTAASRCPMGAEAQCPVLLGRVAETDNFCPDCGYKLAALSAGETFEPASDAKLAPQAWLEDRSGQTHPLRVGSNIVGRENADVLVPDKTVSRSHARLDVDESGGILLEDLTSTNGTQVNDDLLMPHVPRLLADGDRVRFGSITLTLHLAAPEADQEAPAGSSEAQGQVTEMEGGKRAYPLAPGITTFGRRAENNVVLTGDLYVSGKHAQILAENNVFILTDLGSTNGTLLNGERLQINMPVTLDAGDLIVIGGTALRFDRLGPGYDSLDAEELDAEVPSDELNIETANADNPEELTINSEATNDDPDEKSGAEASGAAASAELQTEDVPRHAEG